MQGRWWLDNLHQLGDLLQEIAALYERGRACLHGRVCMRDKSMLRDPVGHAFLHRVYTARRNPACLAIWLAI